MALPSDVQAAKKRMEKAEAAARADVESGRPYDPKRRKPLLAKLQKAMKKYLDKMARLRDR